MPSAMDQESKPVRGILKNNRKAHVPTRKERKLQEDKLRVFSLFDDLDQDEERIRRFTSTKHAYQVEDWFESTRKRVHKVLDRLPCEPQKWTLKPFKLDIQVEAIRDQCDTELCSLIDSWINLASKIAADLIRIRRSCRPWYRRWLSV